MGPHDPVIMDLHFKLIESGSKQETYPAALPNVNWTKVDLNTYQNLTHLKLSALGKNGFKNVHAEVLVSCVNTIRFLVDSALKLGGQRNMSKPQKARQTPLSSEQYLNLWKNRILISITRSAKQKTKRYGHKLKSRTTKPNCESKWSRHRCYMS